MFKTNKKQLTRRSFLVSVSGISAAFVMGATPQRTYGMIVHPDPRPDIDASLVMQGKELAVWPAHIRKIYEKIREIPDIADGIGCACWCKTLPTYRSLLTCYYPKAMAMGCDICQNEATLVYRRHKEGQSLEQIRRAIDARFG